MVIHFFVFGSISFSKVSQNEHCRFRYADSIITETVYQPDQKQGVEKDFEKEFETYFCHSYYGLGLHLSIM